MTLPPPSSTDTLTTAGSFRCLAYGPNGSGKTHSIQTLPKDDTIIIDAEPANGTLSKVKGYKMYRIVAWDAPAAQKNAKRNPGELYGCELLTLFPMESGKTLVFDSLTGLTELALLWFKSQTRDGRAAYGETGDAVVAVVRRFVSQYQGGIIFFARECVEDGRAGALLPGKAIIPTIQSFVNDAGRVSYGESGPTIDFTRGEEHFSRNSNVPAEIRPLDWAAIYSLKGNK